MENANEEVSFGLGQNEFNQNSGIQYDKLPEFFNRISTSDNGKIPIDFVQKGNDNTEQQSHEYHELVNGNGKIMKNRGKWIENGKHSTSI